MIKNIIFDLGGVLIDFDPYKTIRKVFREEDALQVEKALFGSGLWKNLDLGIMHFPELAANCCKLLPACLHKPLTELLLRWWDEMPPLPGMEDFVREVKANGYKVYLCSNTPDDVYDHFDDIPVLQILDGILASCDFGVAKPDRKIFEALYNKFDLDPTECFFIDDMPQNIEGAAKTGMCGFCFAKKDLDALKSALRENGVRI